MIAKQHQPPGPPNDVRPNWKEQPLQPNPAALRLTGVG
jgi:hypothetical protein